MSATSAQKSPAPGGPAEASFQSLAGRRRVSSGLLSDALRRLTRSPAVVASIAFLVIIALIGIAAPLLGVQSPTRQNLGLMYQPPSAEHWLGTDELGRDMLSRLIYGGRVSLLVGLGVQIATTLIGTLLGLVAGYYSGTLDLVIMRAVDIMYAFPSFLFAVFMAAVLPPSVWSILLVLTIVGWPWNARVTRSLVLSLKEAEYVVAARVVGAGNWRIMLQHILPNSLSPTVVGFSIGIAGTIMAESGLSFLGIGIRPPTPSWGAMIDKGRAFLQVYPHLSIYPSLVLALTVLAFNFLGDGLRDALDPRMRE